MKKNGFRVLSMILAVFLICNLFSVSFLSVMADEPEFDASNYVNALADKLPSSVYVKSWESNGPDWGEEVKSIISGTGYDPFGGNGYDKIMDPLYPYDDEESFAPCLAMMTDENVETSCRVMAEYANSRVEIIIYDLREKMNVKAVEIVSGCRALDADVYLSASTGDLFDDANKLGNFKRAEYAYTTESLQTTDQKVRYVGIWLNPDANPWDYYYDLDVIDEIKVYAEKPFDRTAYTNALAGKRPSSVYVTDIGVTTPKHGDKCIIAGTGFDAFYGYTYDDIFDLSYQYNKSELAPHLDMMTDENVETSCRIMPEYPETHDVIIVYDLGEKMAVKAVEMISGCRVMDADVYLSASTGDLFADANKLGNFKRAEYADMTDSLQTTDQKVRYIGIRLNTDANGWNYYYELDVIDEIKVYAEKPFNRTAYTNALAGKRPSSVYAANIGAITPAYGLSVIQGTGLAVRGDDGDDLQTYDDIFDLLYQYNKSELAPHLVMMTDGNVETSCLVRPKYPENFDEIIIYDLGERMDVKAVEMISGCFVLDADVYLSATTGDLFSDANKLGSFQRSGGEYTTDSLQTTDQKVRYMGIRLNHDGNFWTGGYSGSFDIIDEIKVYASPVIVYGQGEFAGDETCFACGSFNLQDASIGSFKVLDGFAVTLFDGADCTGNSLVFGRSVSAAASLDFGTVASVKIEKADRYIVADANGDQEINIKDLISMKKNAAQMIDANLAMDLNNDGKVDGNDLIAMKKNLLGVA